MGGDPQRDAAGGGAAAIPVDDAINWMFRPPVTQEQTDAWFQPAAQPSALPEPTPAPPQAPDDGRPIPGDFMRNLRIAASEVVPELKGMLNAPVEFAQRAADPSLSVPQRLAAAVGTVASAAQLDPLMPRGGEKIPAGGGFAWGAKPIEDIQGLPKSGVMPESRFAKAGSEAGQFSKDELALMKQLVPDAFTESGVDVPKLHEGLQESGPVVEVKKLNVAGSTPGDQRLLQIEHELDTRFPQWQQGFTPPEAITLVNERAQLLDDLSTGGRSGGAQYGFLGPKPENQMPGYIEGLVRLPVDPKGLETSTFPTDLKYRGPHFGSEDTNVLSHYRGYEETLPSGEKAFHVIEVQSDWGQNVRKEAEFQKENPATKLEYPPHPLLQHYETLGLKAAIQHAKEIGATKVILPDAETAMMTEGHDKAALPWEVLDEKGILHDSLQTKGQAHEANDKVFDGKGTVRFNPEVQPPQVGGMRLHYDQTLPSTMRKLTGDKGQPIDLGTHDKVIMKGTREAGSPVFKNPDGTPKTNITGKIYDISKTPDQFKLMKAGDKFSAAKYLPA